MGRAKIKLDEGRITTPFKIALYMVSKLFSRRPSPTSRVLDAGCGDGVFIEAIITWCRRERIEPPEIVGIEIDPLLARRAQMKFRDVNKVRIIQGDFLIITEQELGGKFDYIISNPPYISYEKIDPAKRDLYRKLFRVAVGRFDMYMLFFEKALDLLKPYGRMVFITPEKYLYTISARNLRKLLARYHVEEIELVYEDAFQGVLAYPTITTIVKEPPSITTIRFRNGLTLRVMLPADGSSWLAAAESPSCVYRYRLKDLALRISAGVATGCDDVFVIPKDSLPRDLEPYAYPTVSGRELSTFSPGDIIDYSKLRYVMLVPYDRSGRLLSEEEARPLISYLARFRHRLESRYVVRSGRKRWYAFHEDPPMRDLLKPKILWCDIAREPAFYVDAKGLIIPRHNVYYLVPKDPDVMPKLIKYLNSDEVKEWLRAHCQRAASGYLRLQSHILKELPIPDVLQGYH